MFGRNRIYPRRSASLRIVDLTNIEEMIVKPPANIRTSGAAMKKV